MNDRELCRFCNRKVAVLPSGRLAHHHYVAPGIGIPCPGAMAKDTQSVCPECGRADVRTDWRGRIYHHYARTNVTCKGVGRLPGVAA